MIDERLKDSVVVASISGGKDSAAMSLWLTEQGIEHRRVFADTGWEAPETYDYIREVLPRAIGPIDVVGRISFVELVRKKQMFPSRLSRFCTTGLKVEPIKAYVEAVEGAVVNAVGLRAGESKARAELGSWEWLDFLDGWQWRPILAWSVQDVIEIHKRHGLVPNPLYLRGASRVGCWPCIFARKAEIRFVAEQDPARIELIAALERELWERPGSASRPTYYHTHERTGRPVPIAEVVAWATEGSEQADLFPQINDGCMRWGMCETAPEDE